MTASKTTADREGRLLPDRIALNVNYPVVLNEAGLFDASQVDGPTVTSVGHAEVVRPTYLPIPNTTGTYVAQGPICGLATACAPETEDDADTTALAQGEISITPIAVDGTANQVAYLEAIKAHDLSFGIGPAGTGKTYLAVACAVDALERDAVKRIVLVRPAVEAGESLGFLPDDLQAKINPY